MADEQSAAGRVSEAMSSRGVGGKRDYVRSLELRQGRLARVLLIDPSYAGRLQRLLRAEVLMAQPDPDTLRDDSPRVRASEEGAAWDTTESPPGKPGMTATPGSTPSTAHGVDSA